MFNRRFLVPAIFVIAFVMSTPVYDLPDRDTPRRVGIEVVRRFEDVTGYKIYGVNKSYFEFVIPVLMTIIMVIISLVIFGYESAKAMDREEEAKTSLLSDRVEKMDKGAILSKEEEEENMRLITDITNLGNKYKMGALYRAFSDPFPKNDSDGSTTPDIGLFSPPPSKVPAGSSDEDDGKDDEKQSVEETKGGFLEDLGLERDREQMQKVKEVHDLTIENIRKRNMDSIALSKRDFETFQVLESDVETASLVSNVTAKVEGVRSQVITVENKPEEIGMRIGDKEKGISFSKEKVVDVSCELETKEAGKVEALSILKKAAKSEKEKIKELIGNINGDIVDIKSRKEKLENRVEQEEKELVDLNEELVEAEKDVVEELPKLKEKLHRLKRQKEKKDARDFRLNELPKRREELEKQKKKLMADCSREEQEIEELRERIHKKQMLADNKMIRKIQEEQGRMTKEDWERQKRRIAANREQDRRDSILEAEARKKYREHQKRAAREKERMERKIARKKYPVEKLPAYYWWEQPRDQGWFGWYPFYTYLLPGTTELSNVGFGFTSGKTQCFMAGPRIEMAKKWLKEFRLKGMDQSYCGETLPDTIIRICAGDKAYPVIGYPYDDWYKRYRTKTSYRGREIRYDDDYAFRIVAFLSTLGFSPFVAGKDRDKGCSLWLFFRLAYRDENRFSLLINNYSSYCRQNGKIERFIQECSVFRKGCRKNEFDCIGLFVGQMRFIDKNISSKGNQERGLNLAIRNLKEATDFSIIIHEATGVEYKWISGSIFGRYSDPRSPILREAYDTRYNEDEQKEIVLNDDDDENTTSKEASIGSYSRNTQNAEETPLTDIQFFNTTTLLNDDSNEEMEEEATEEDEYEEEQEYEYEDEDLLNDPN